MELRHEVVRKRLQRLLAALHMQTPFTYLRMQTTYYDTEDGALEKNRWMLRLRTENDRSVVTMKTPGAGHTRGEWEVESEYLDEALPALAKLGAPEAIGRLDAEALLNDRRSARLELDGNRPYWMIWTKNIPAAADRSYGVKLDAETGETVDIIGAIG